MWVHADALSFCNHGQIFLQCYIQGCIFPDAVFPLALLHGCSFPRAALTDAVSKYFFPGTHFVSPCCNQGHFFPAVLHSRLELFPSCCMPRCIISYSAALTGAVFSPTLTDAIFPQCSIFTDLWDVFSIPAFSCARTCLHGLTATAPSLTLGL
jgi:hypothetical protein